MTSRKTFLWMFFALAFTAKYDLKIELENGYIKNNPQIKLSSEEIGEKIQIIVRDPQSESKEFDLEPGINLTLKRKGLFAAGNLYTIDISDLYPLRNMAVDISILYAYKDKINDREMMLSSTIHFPSGTLDTWFRDGNFDKIKKYMKRESKNIHIGGKVRDLIKVKVNKSLAKIKGSIKNESGVPMEDVEVSLDSKTVKNYISSKGFKRKVNTDSDGHFNLSNINISNFPNSHQPYLILSKPGFEPLIYDNISRDDLIFGFDQYISQKIKDYNQNVECSTTDLHKAWEGPCTVCICKDSQLEYYESKNVCAKPCNLSEEIERWEMDFNNKNQLICIPKYEKFSKKQENQAWEYVVQRGFVEPGNTITIKGSGPNDKQKVRNINETNFKEKFRLIKSDTITRIEVRKGFSDNFSNAACDNDKYFRISFSINGTDIKNNIKIYDLDNQYPDIGVNKSSKYAISSNGSSKYLSRNFYYTTRYDNNNRNGEEYSIIDSNPKKPLSCEDDGGECWCGDVDTEEQKGDCPREVCEYLEGYEDENEWDSSSCENYFVLDKKSSGYYYGTGTNLAVSYNGNEYDLILFQDRSLCDCGYVNYACEFKNNELKCIAECIFEETFVQNENNEKNGEEEEYKKIQVLKDDLREIKSNVCLEIFPDLYDRYVSSTGDDCQDLDNSEALDKLKKQKEDAIDKIKEIFSLKAINSAMELTEKILNGEKSTGQIENIKSLITQYESEMRSFTIPDYALDGLDTYLATCGEIVLQDFNALDKVSKVLSKEINNIIKNTDSGGINTFFKNLYYPTYYRDVEDIFDPNKINQSNSHFARKSIFMHNDNISNIQNSGYFDNFYIDIEKDESREYKPGITILEFLDAIYQKMDLLASNQYMHDTIKDSEVRLANFYRDRAKFYQMYFFLIFTYKKTDEANISEKRNFVTIRGFKKEDDSEDEYAPLDASNVDIDPTDSKHYRTYNWDSIAKHTCGEAIDSYEKYNKYATNANKLIEYFIKPYDTQMRDLKLFEDQLNE